MLAERPWEELPPELAPAMRPGLGALADEMIETIRATVPGLRAAARGRGRRGRARRRRGRAVAVPRRHRAGPRRAAARARAVRRPRPRRGARGPQPRGAARRLPDRRARGVAARGRAGARARARRRGAGAARGVDLRLHRRAVGRVRGGLRARAVRRRRRARPPPRRARAAADPAARRPIPPRSSWPRATRGTELPERLAAVVWAPREDDRTASWLPLGSLRRDGSAPRARPRPRRARPPRRDRARLRPPAAALGPTVPWRDAARSARARRPTRSGCVDEPPGLVRAEDHLTTLLLGARPVADRRAGRAAPGPARRRDARRSASACWRRSAPGSSTRAASPTWHARSTCTRRPCATGSTSCATLFGDAGRPRRALRAAACHPRTRSARRVVARMSRTRLAAALPSVP